MKVYIIDTETTNADDTAEIIEAAWLDMDGGEYCERFKPQGQIAFGAMATHHILPSDLEGCRESAAFILPACDFVVGHNIDFDWRVMGSPDAKRICTLAFCRHLWPELDSHKQGAMMYFLFGEEAREMVQKAHCALDDVKMCQMIFYACINELAQRGVNVDSWEDIWQASEMARIPTVMSFGKHKGKPLAEVPEDYINWYLKQAEQDQYMRTALLNEMIRRRS